MIRALGSLVLCLLALATGGCSLAFTPLLFEGGLNTGLLPIWLTGCAIAGLAVWGARRLWPRHD